jgi:hypothetical protein
MGMFSFLDEMNSDIFPILRLPTASRATSKRSDLAGFGADTSQYSNQILW